MKLKEQVREFARQQEYRERSEKSRDEVYIETPATSIGLLVASGDKHIGAPGWDWAKFEYDTRMVLETENCYEIDLGDILDNLFFASGDDIFNAREQINLVNAWAKAMLDKGKMLATIGGNHQEWFYKYMSIEFFMLAYGFGDLVPHLRDGGDIYWRYGSVDYQIRGNHRTRYNSDLNPHHTNHRTYWMVAPDADIILSAHSHSLTNEEWAIKREGTEQNVHFGKTGSYKGKDRFRDANGHIPQWQTGALCYTVNPITREIWQVIGVDKGIRLQEMLNWELEHHKRLPVQTILRDLQGV